MGKKNSSKKKSYVYTEPEQTEDSSNDSGFAAKLLSSMGIDDDTNNDSSVKEEAVEDGEEEIKHPHLHQLHQTFKAVFKRDSRSDSDEKSTISKSEAKAEEKVSSNPTDCPDTRANTDTTQSDPNQDAHSKSNSRSAEGTAVESSDTRSVNTTATTKTTESQAPGKKRNRRKEKSAERERERARIVQQAQAEAETIPDKRAIESKGMGMMIAKAGLCEHEVQPDGHCSFHSSCDQLAVRRDIHLSVQQLRTELANYIRDNAEDFIPYLIEDETGNVQNVDKYTSDLETTPMWGGELEIMAASCLFKSPIRVFFASQPPLTINEDRFPDTEPLNLAYYQAKFGLGAHYNSLRDAPENENHAKDHSD